jgi:hypothetical protein
LLGEQINIDSQLLASKMVSKETVRDTLLTLETFFKDKYLPPQPQQPEPIHMEEADTVQESVSVRVSSNRCLINYP